MKIFTGKVIAKKSAKTATVEVKRVVVHPLYKKRLIRKRKYLVHDETDESQVGDKVSFVGGRPISKMKKWRLI